MPIKKKRDLAAARAARDGKRAADAALARRREASVDSSKRAPRQAKGAAVPRPVRALAARYVAAAGAAPQRGTLVAEGDSWFDYPFNDVLTKLQDEHGYAVEKVAHRGDSIEEMAYSGGQLDDLCRAIQKVVRTGVAPRAILLSGGGNDLAGEQFGMLLNHAGSPIGGFNEDVVRGVVDVRVRLAIITIVAQVTQVCVKLTGERVPIVTHGYAHPVPDGRGVLGGWGPLPGSWLRPGFYEKGFGSLDHNTALMADLIDRFNGMLNEVAKLPNHGHVTVVDLRKTLSNGDQYKNRWANELQPTESGFGAVADEFAAVIG
jgi:hypothetical protein